MRVENESRHISPNSGKPHLFKRESIDAPLVTVIYDVPLADLLGPKDKKNPIAGDTVSIYSYGSEHAVVWPGLHGQEQYKRLLKIARYDPGIGDVAVDSSYILQKNGQKLLQRHTEKLGLLWDTFSFALSHQAKVFNDALEFKEPPYVSGKDASDALGAIGVLETNPLQPDFSREKAVEKMYGILNGNPILDIAEFANFFMLDQYDVVDLIPEEQEDISYELIEELMKGNGSAEQLVWLKNILISAAKQSTSRANSYGTESIDPFLLDNYATFLSAPEVMAKIVEDDKTYLMPIDLYKILDDGPLSHLTEFSVGANGELVVDQNARQKLEAIKRRGGKGIYYFGHLSIPIVRIRRSNSVAGFVFHGAKGAPPLPQAVTDDILNRVNDSGASRFEAKEDWISGKVGVETIVMAHESVRNKKDDWSQVWKSERITYSQITEENPEPGEYRQFNGPVQAGIIALAAFARYPQSFEHFTEKVRELGRA